MLGQYLYTYIRQRPHIHLLPTLYLLYTYFIPRSAEFQKGHPFGDRVCKLTRSVPIYIVAIQINNLLPSGSHTIKHIVQNTDWNLLLNVIQLFFQLHNVMQACAACCLCNPKDSLQGTDQVSLLIACNLKYLLSVIKTLRHGHEQPSRGKTWQS